MQKIMYALIIGFLFTTIATVYSNSVQADLSNNLIRLHVVADSDLEVDQNIKLHIRDCVLNSISDKIMQGESPQECREIVKDNLDLIEQIANEELEKRGFDYTAKAFYGKFEFPTKMYDNIMLPAGEYEAVRIVLGSGEGQNWWCVMFPPLCFVEESKGNMNDSSINVLKEQLDSESYDIITNSNSSHLDVEFKFKIVEFVQESKQRLLG